MKVKKKKDPGMIFLDKLNKLLKREAKINKKLTDDHVFIALLSEILALMDAQDNFNYSAGVGSRIIIEISQHINKMCAEACK